jgi:hypothetical protein
MKKKQKLFFSFVVMLVMTIIAMAGCEKGTTFPSGFRTTWIRESGYMNTLTFTSTILKASNQNSAWELMGISGDVYMMKNTGGSKVIELTIKLKNGKLEISGDGGSGEDNWNGIWIKQ